MPPAAIRSSAARLLETPAATLEVVPRSQMARIAGLGRAIAGAPAVPDLRVLRHGPRRALPQAPSALIDVAGSRAAREDVEEPANTSVRAAAGI